MGCGRTNDPVNETYVEIDADQLEAMNQTIDDFCQLVLSVMREAATGGAYLTLDQLREALEMRNIEVSDKTLCTLLGVLEADGKVTKRKEIRFRPKFEDE